MMNEAQARQDQIAYGRSQIIEEASVGSLSTRRISTTTLGKKPFVKSGPKPSGHEAFLKALESSNATIEVEKASSGDKIVGKIKASDKYTISLRVPNVPGDWDGPYQTRVIFKSDISEFSPLIVATPTAEVH